MSLLVNVVKRKVPAGEHAGEEMYYGQVSVNTRISFEKLCNKIAHHCMATYSDVAGVLKELLTCVASTLENGNIVRLGRLGNLRLAAGSTGTEEKDDFSLRDMKTPRVVFSPGKMLRDMLAGVKFRKENVKEITKILKCERMHTE